MIFFDNHEKKTTFAKRNTISNSTMSAIKTFCLSIASLVTACLCQAQQAVVAYDYDAAGNRVARRLVFDPPQQSPPRSPSVSHEIGSVTVSPTVTGLVSQ